MNLRVESFKLSLVQSICRRVRKITNQYIDSELRERLTAD